MPARLPLRYAAIAALSVLLAALLMAGCGAQRVTSPRADSATPTPQADHSTALPTPGRDTPAVTNVLITTDSQTYTPGDTIHVTITNHVGTPIFATSGKANCTVVEAQRKTAQGWQTTHIAPCADTDSTDIVQIAAGARHTAEIATGGSAPAVPAGTYRLALSYSTFSIPPQMSASLNGAPLLGKPIARAKSSPLTTVYSQAFTIG